ncbi:MAG: immune inhibitor A [Aeromonas sp.]|nr:immune inhibitor A domain-containing protein [Aeromonas sp.]MCX7133235.1 immune inhibitor A [Aeromonas sp.]
MAAPVHGPFDAPLADEVKVLEMLKKSGRIPTLASPEMEQAALASFYREKSRAYNGSSGTLAVKEGKVRETILKKIRFNGTARPGDRVPTLLLKAIEKEHYQGKMRKDKILAILVDFPDYPKNSVSPELTKMYYPDYTQAHYNDLLFSDKGYAGPNGEKFISMRQFYEQQSGKSYSVRGQVAGWYTASKNAAYYGANATPNTIRDLVKEALIQIANDPAIDLAQFDQEDRYDLNGNGNRDEPDGLIDHLMIFHSSVGEEAGGGDLGEDAIWAHRWNLGTPYPIPGTSSPHGSFGGQFAAYDYTIQPIDAAAGVCAHEYGHDLGLPDEYDTKYTGKGEPVATWSIMSSGSWAGVIGGTEPTGFSAWAKEFLQASLGGNWLHGSNVQLADLSPRGNVYMLDQANDKGRNDDVVRINLPAKQIPLNPPYAGQYQYHGGKANNLDNRMNLKLDLGGKQSASLAFKAWYQIEEGYDYARVLVNGQPIAGNLTTSDDPNGVGFGVGITGNSNGWTDAEFDLTPWAGQQITLTLQYQSDGGVAENGLFVDELQVAADGEVLLSDGAEGSSAFTLAGFVKSNGNEAKDHYYLAEWRNHAGVDKGLAHINVSDQLMRYEPGMLLWYVDNSQDNNWVGVHPGEGFLGVVDADQNRVFKDSRSYQSKEIPDAGRLLPEYGLKISVTGQARDMSTGRIIVSRH